MLTRARAARALADTADLTVRLSEDLNYLRQETSSTRLDNLQENITLSLRHIDDYQQLEAQLQEQIRVLQEQLQQEQRKLTAEQQKSKSLTRLLEDHDDNNTTPQEEIYQCRIRELESRLQQLMLPVYQNSTAIQTDILLTPPSPPSSNMSQPGYLDMITPFTGDTDTSSVRDFLTQLEQVADIGQWTDGVKRQVCLLKIRGVARQSVAYSQLEQELTFDSLKKKLLHIFQPKVTATEINEIFLATRQFSNEPLWKYIARMRDAADKYFASMQVTKQNGVYPAFADAKLCHVFIRGLNNQFKPYVESSRVESFEEAVKAAEYKSNLLRADTQGPLPPDTALAALTEGMHSLKAQLTDIKQELSTSHLPVTYTLPRQHSPRPAAASDSVPREVLLTKVVSDPHRTTFSESFPRRDRSSRSSRPRWCTYCRRDNHEYRDCFLRQKDERQRRNNSNDRDSSPHRSRFSDNNYNGSYSRDSRDFSRERRHDSTDRRHDSPERRYGNNTRNYSSVNANSWRQQRSVSRGSNNSSSSPRVSPQPARRSDRPLNE